MAEPANFSLIIGAAMEHYPPPPQKIPGFNGDFPRRQCEMSVTEIFELPCFIKSIDFPYLAGNIQGGTVLHMHSSKQETALADAGN